MLITLCRHTMLVVRGLCSFASIFLLYTSLQLMPLSDSVVLQFLSPIMVAFAAPLLLKELPSRQVERTLLECIWPSNALALLIKLLILMHCISTKSLVSISPDDTTTA